MLERRFMATDLCGNNTLEIQTVTVTDNDLPYFTFVPEDRPYTCTRIPVYEEAMARTIVPLSNSPNRGHGSWTVRSNYDMIRTFTVTDACGNMADATQTIAVRDRRPPSSPRWTNPLWNATTNGALPPWTPSTTAPTSCGT